MASDEEQRRRRNAKRFLWLILLATVLLLALIAYTSIEAPEPGLLPDAPVPARGEGIQR